VLGIVAHAPAVGAESHNSAFWKITVFNDHPAVTSCHTKGHGRDDDHSLAGALGVEPVVGAEVGDAGIGMRDHLASVHVGFYGRSPNRRQPPRDVR
jgi:hypothetical protein